MAFGIRREELNQWKQRIENGEIAIITHYWDDARFPESTSVTKVGCKNVAQLIAWGKQYALKAEWIDYSHCPHFDVFGSKQKEILLKEGFHDQIKRFNL